MVAREQMVDARITTLDLVWHLGGAAVTDPNRVMAFPARRAR
jgi:hypothetical protein